MTTLNVTEGVVDGMDAVFSQIADFFTAGTGPIPVVWSWITSADVLPFATLGIGVSLILFGVKVVRGTIWGL